MKVTVKRYSDNGDLVEIVPFRAFYTQPNHVCNIRIAEYSKGTQIEIISPEDEAKDSIKFLVYINLFWTKENKFSISLYKENKFSLKKFFSSRIR